MSWAGLLVAALVLACYRLVISPATAWTARTLSRPHGAGPARAAAYGAYPPSTPRRDARAAAAVGLLVLGGAACVVLAPALTWTTALPALVATASIGYKTLTQSFDLAAESKWQARDRAVAAVLFAAALLAPALAWVAVAWACARLGAWTHHTKTSVRVVKLFIAWLLVTPLARHAADVDLCRAVLQTLVVLVFLSHYYTAAVSKIRLGPRLSSWVRQNRIDSLVTAAHAWGWLRWLPAARVEALVALLRRSRVAIGTLTLIVELDVLVAFTSRTATVLAVLAAAVFNLSVGVLSGLMFWENAVLGGAIALTLVVDPSRVDVAYGLAPWTLGLLLLLIVAATRIWSPADLGWWDTPLTTRIRWHAVFASGERTEIPTRCFAPYDREFARMLGYRLTSTPIVTYSLGGTEDVATRDAIFALDGRPGGLEDVEARFGTVHYDPAFAAEHAEFLRRWCAGIPAHQRAGRLLGAARRLRAPGGHQYAPFSPGLSAFMHTERIEVSRHDVLYRPGQGWLALRDELLLTVRIETPVGATR